MTNNLIPSMTLAALLWSTITIGLYVVTKKLHRRWRRWWNMPVILAPVLLVVLATLSQTSYADYLSGTRWLMAMLGPATAAFALPIYQQRQIIRRHWPVLVVGVTVGSLVAMLSAWGLATALGIDGAIRLSIIPRSVTTPFAMVISEQIGGQPNLAAVFAISTGIFGALIGEAILIWQPMRSALINGIMFGMGAHAVGTVKIYQTNKEIGAISGLIMVLAGIANVLASPLLAYILRA